MFWSHLKPKGVHRVFWSRLKPKGVIWKGDVQEEKWGCSQRRLCGGSVWQGQLSVALWPEMSLHCVVTVSRQPQPSVGVPGPLQSVCGCCWSHKASCVAEPDAVLP